MHQANPTKCKLVFESLDRVISNLHFSQSMSEFFASDGSIETSKLVVAEALKRGADLGKFLRGGSFASCANVYRNLTSSFDFDAAYFLNQNNKKGKRVFGPNAYKNKGAQYRQKPDRPSYPIGCCFNFQEKGRCNTPRCPFDHSCAYCHRDDHGAETCYRKNYYSKQEQKTHNRETPNDGL